MASFILRTLCVYVFFSFALSLLYSTPFRYIILFLGCFESVISMSAGGFSMNMESSTRLCSVSCLHRLMRRTCFDTK